MANRDLEFTLKFKNESKAVLKQAQADLAALGRTAGQVATQLKSLNTSGASVQASMNKTALEALKTEAAERRLEIQTAKLTLAEQKLALQQQALALTEQRLQQQTDRLALSQQRLDQQKGRLNVSSNKLVGSFLALGRAFLPLTLATAAFGTIKIADDFKLLSARVENATETTAEFNQAFTGLQRIARDTGAGMEPVVSIFQRLSFTRKEIKATVAEMLQFTDTVSKLGVISGASPDALKFGLTQLGQSLSSNIVRAEEFNSIMENIPAVGKQIADELGVTTGQLRLLVVNGKLLSKDVFAAMLNATEEVNAQFEKFPETIGRAFQGLLQDLSNGIGAFDKATGASKILIATIYGVGKAIKSVLELMAALGYQIQAIYKIIMASIASLMNSTLLGIQTVINAAIDGLNNFRKEKIPPIEIALDMEQFNKAATEDIGAAMDKANEQLAKSGNTALSIIGLDDKSAAEASKNSRKISQDYAAIAKTLGDGKKKKKDPAETFYRDLANEIEKLKEEAFWQGKSNKERERATALLKVQQDAIKAGIKDFDPTEYLAAYDALQRAKERVHQDFGAGLQSAMTDFIESAKGAGDLAQDVFKSMADGISGTFRDLVTGSIDSFSDLKSAVGNILADISGQIAEFVITQQLIQPLLQSFGLFGFGGGGLSGAGVGGTSYLLNAKGNAFSNGSKVTMFAKGGVLNGPTAFPMNNGIGIGGEAGDEGLLPLKRMANGALGVQASGSGSGTQVNYSPSFKFQLGGDQAGGTPDPENVNQFIKGLNDDVKKLVMSVIEKEQRPGGRLYGGK